MYLGLDLGTSSLKAVVIDQSGKLRALVSEPLVIIKTKPGWSEQHPASWIRALRKALLKLKAQKHLALIKAIGVAGQMHGAVLLNQAGEVIYPAILWNDTRSYKEAQFLSQQSHLEKIFGNITFAGFTAPKILWLRKHRPQIACQIATVLLPKDYLNFWLTGNYTSDMSDASGTAWLDIAKRRWSTELLAASGLTTDNMPRLIEGDKIAATIKPQVASEFGMPQAVVVAGGAGDNAASAVGIGLEAQEGFISLGTSGVVFAVGTKFLPDPKSAVHSFCHAQANLWHQMGVTLSATDSLNWALNQLQLSPKRLAPLLGELTAPGPELFLPFLGGERTPYNNPLLRATFDNLGHHSDQSALIKAVLEGVGFSLFNCLSLLEKSNSGINRLIVVGGGANLDYWVKLLASLFNRPLVRIENSSHAAAWGAARLGALAINQDIPLDQQQQIFSPVNELAELFKNKLAGYNRLVQQKITALKN